MCKSCKPDANYFLSVDCVYEYLLPAHPVLRLRDSFRTRPGYVSRSLLCPAGKVLAIQNRSDQSWRLRKDPNETLDEIPDEKRREFVLLTDEAARFQAFLFTWR